ncbi:hypothetical protein ACFE04_017595 [Oxalis oulophora]
MSPNSVPRSPSNNIDVADSDMSKYGFKIHIGGELMFRPLDYVGGECWDYKAVPEEMNMKELHSIIRQLTDDNVEVLSIHYKRFHLSMAAGLTPVDNEDDVTTLVEHWKEDGKVDVFVEMVKIGLHSVTNDQDSGNEHVETDVGTDVGTDEDDVSVDDVSFCSDREDDELVSLMTQAAQVTQSAATHGPETDAIRQNRGDKKGYSSDKEYELEPNYLEDPTLHWSFTTDEDYDDNIGSGDDEAQSGLGTREEEEVPHTEELVRHNRRTCPDKNKDRINVEDAGDAQGTATSRPPKVKLTIGLPEANTSSHNVWMTSPKKKKKRTPRRKESMLTNEDNIQTMTKLLWSQISSAGLDVPTPAFQSHVHTPAFLPGPRLVKKRKAAEENLSSKKGKKPWR